MGALHTPKSRHTAHDHRIINKQNENLAVQSVPLR